MARKSPAENSPSWNKSGSVEVIRRHLAHVVEEGGIGEAVGEDAASLVVDLDRNTGRYAGRVHRQVETANAGEERYTVELRAELRAHLVSPTAAIGNSHSNGSRCRSEGGDHARVIRIS